MSKNKRGYTLIESIVVIAIVFIYFIYFSFIYIKPFYINTLRDLQTLH